jgi:hypothetical protein
MVDISTRCNVNQCRRSFYSHLLGSIPSVRFRKNQRDAEKSGFDGRNMYEAPKVVGSEIEYLSIGGRA